MSKVVVRAGLGLAVVVVAAQVMAADWTRWRGPDGNGITEEKGWSPAALAQGPKIAWKADVQNGYSAVSVAAGHVYTMGNRDKKDTIWCLDEKTGAKVWSHSYPCEGGSYEGPRATPTVEDGLVYTISRNAQVFCLRATNGEVVWSRELFKDSKAANIGWGIAGSVCIEGKLLLVNVGESGAALDKATGKTVWASAGKSGYSTPVVVTAKGKRVAVLFSQNDVRAVEVQTGAKLWSHPWETRYDVNAADPVMDGNRVFISSGYDKGCAMLDVTTSTPKVVWQQKNMRNHFSTCVLWKGHLFGIDGNTGGGTLRCLDWKTGQEKWSHDTGFGSLIIADEKLIILNENGHLSVAEASLTGYKELAAGRIIERKVCWTAPVLSNGRLYGRNSHGDLVCVTLAP